MKTHSRTNPFLAIFAIIIILAVIMFAPAVAAFQPKSHQQPAIRYLIVPVQIPQGSRPKAQGPQGPLQA